MLSRKHYEAVASILAFRDTKAQIVDGLVSYFSRDNPRFPVRQRFHRAVSQGCRKA